MYNMINFTVAEVSQTRIFVKNKKWYDRLKYPWIAKKSILDL